MWCVPELTKEYVQAMEDVLDLYEEPLDEREPVVCLDEKSTQLLRDARAPIPADGPGKIMKRDSEYVRCGTANVFAAVEPKAGRHFTWVTKTRKATDFAKVVARLDRAYPDVNTIHLVMDNLNTHCQKSLTKFYGPKEGARLWRRFTVHHTPKHGSWLNQAEIEIGLFSRQCLGRARISDLGSLRRRTAAWNQRMNRREAKIHWRFTTEKARQKFGYNSPRFKRSEH